jgi:hypothetical protein
MAQTGRVRIRVLDPTGAVVITARASLIGADGKAVRTVQVNKVGELVLTDLPSGDSQFLVSAIGFKDRRLTISVRNGDEVKLDTALELCGGILQTC